MGVKGLLPALQSITKQVLLEKYKGLTAAVDAMCWLHKGIFTGDVASLAKYQFLLEDIENSKEALSSEEEKFHQDRNEELVENVDCTIEMVNNNDMPVKRLDFDTCFTQKKSGKVLSRTKEDGNLDLPRHVLELQNNAKNAVFDCIAYVIRQTNSLRNDYGIEPILIIDGNELPSKANTNAERKKNRIQAFQDGLKNEMKQNHREARKHFAKACSITHEMRHELVLQCRRHNISYIIAPYEADAQLAYLAHSGVADFVITEDSDLLAYAAPRVLFKVDLKTGKGDEIQIMRDLASNDGLDFRHWNHDMFVYMCILTGCDYFAGVPGVGIQMAHKLVRIHRTPSKIFDAMKRKGKWPDGFDDAFWIAYRTFRHQRIFCTETNCIDSLFPIENNIVNGLKVDSDQIWSFLGGTMTSEVALAVANGSLHPKEKRSWNEVLQRNDMELRHACSALESKEQHLLDFFKQTRDKNDRKSHHIITSEKKRNHISPIKENIFSFFRPNKRTNAEKSARVPLKEIQVNSSCISNCVTTSVSGFRSRGTKAVPSNDILYSSNLVARTFEPISRVSNSKRNINILEKKRGVTRAIHQLKEKLSLKKILEREKQRAEQIRLKEEDEKRRVGQIDEDAKRRQYEAHFTCERDEGIFHDVCPANDFYSFDYGLDDLSSRYDEEFHTENYDPLDNQDERSIPYVSTKKEASNISYPPPVPNETHFSAEENPAHDEFSFIAQYDQNGSDTCFDYTYYRDEHATTDYEYRRSTICGLDTIHDHDPHIINNQMYEDDAPSSSLLHCFDGMSERDYMI